MTDKITTTIYNYTIRGNYATDYRSVPIAVEEGNALWVDYPLQRDEIIGGPCVGIKRDTLELIYQVYDVDESVFNHSHVTWWDKKVVENEVTITKLPTQKKKPISWKSRNRGGGVKHKNFDKTDAKLYYPETVKPPTPDKPTQKIINEPPMGIMNIIKKETPND